MNKGNRYAKQKMWALAAVHFRKAAYQMAELIEPQLSLAVAYNNLKMYDKMAISLAKAKELSPNDPRVQKLTTLMNQKLRQGRT